MPRARHSADRFAPFIAPFLAPLAASLLLAACGADPSSPDGQPPREITALPRALSAGERGLIAASNGFATRLLASVNVASPADNVFLSPLSASMALGMTMNGTSGTTFSEMQATLGFGSLPREEILASYRDLIALLRSLDPKVDMRIANAIWYRNSFGPAINPAFLSEASQFFDARSAGLDFGAPSALTTINDWVKTATNNRIEKIVDQLNSDLVMLLVNAIYFKGDWRTGFDRSHTSSASFTPASGAAISVPMMRRTGVMRAAKVDGRTMVDLGYGGDAFSMTVVLPREGETADAMVASLTPSSLETAVSALHTQEVELTLPRFKISWEDTLNDALKAMGMPTAFIPREADFSRLSPTMGRELYISFVKQKTFVDVNEEGTEAAAVTGVGVGVVSLPQRLVVRVDRPFVFLIRERLSGTILFMGKIGRPPAA